MEHSRPLLFQIRRIPGEEPLVRVASSSSPTLPPCDLWPGPSGPGAGSLTPTWETPAGTWWQRLHFLNPRPRSLPHHVPLPQTPSSRQSPCLWCDVCLIQSLAADPYRLLGTGQQQLPVPTQWHLRHLASSWQERPSHSGPRR